MSYIPIRSFDNYIYANILLSRLKEEGFDCYLKDENTITIDPLLSPAIGGMKLMIQEADIAQVTALLERIDVEYLATIPCPSCGRHALQRLTKTTSPKNFLSALAAQLFAGSTQQETRFYRCSYCGSRLDDLPEITGQ